MCAHTNGNAVQKRPGKPLRPSLMGDDLALKLPLEDFTVVVQAGGASRRMGTSKALVQFGDEPLVARQVRKFMPIASSIVVTTNEPEKLGFLEDEFGSGAIHFERDMYEDRGALKGLYTALISAQTEYVAVIAVDMVFADPNLTIAEYAELVNTGAHLAIPHLEGGYEPFHAVYRRNMCLRDIRAFSREGEQRATGWFTDATMAVELDEDYIRAATGGLDCFSNANTPQELANLIELAPTVEGRRKGCAAGAGLHDGCGRAR